MRVVACQGVMIAALAHRPVRQALGAMETPQNDEEETTMKHQTTLALLLSSLAALPSCGNSPTRVYEATCLSNGKKAILCLPGLDQTSWLRLGEPGNLPLPGDKVEVVHAKDGSVASYRVERAKRLKVSNFRAPGAAPGEGKLVAEEGEYAIEESALIEGGLPLNADWDFSPRADQSYFLPYWGELAAKSTIRPTYLLSETTLVDAQEALPEELKNDAVAYAKAASGNVETKGELRGIAIPAGTESLYAGLYPSLARFVLPEGAFSVPLAEDLLKIYTLDGAKKIYVETLTGAGATYEKASIG